MEYTGGAITDPSVIRRELVHSWFARGVYPESDQYNWIDEAITSYLSLSEEEQTIGIREGQRPTSLHSPFVWGRGTTSYAAYSLGASLLVTLALEFGRDEVMEVVSALFLSGETLTTDRLEVALACSLSEERVHALFHRYVYGLEDSEARETAPPSCGGS